jgi:Beta-xylosidase
VSKAAQTWISDNGNGTFTNPLFYEDFPDPDLIRVGNDYYLTSTTMHSMPGLPVLHSRDLVNWKLLSYAFDRLDLGPAFRLEDEQESYGQGIWAPCLRYHNGTFYIFTNINKQTTQCFRATNPRGPWTRHAMRVSLHDLSVLFDDDGKVYVIWGYGDIHLAELNETLDDLVPGTERIIIPKDAGMGEGVHFYKISGKYYITSAWFAGRMRMPCARADRPEGPYEVNLEISADEDFGLLEGNRLKQVWGGSFELAEPDPASVGRMSLHQGGIVDTVNGEWWGFSMMDYNSLGRVTCLSPVTWRDGWPYFGLSGNLKRTPRTWLKPNTGYHSTPTPLFQRNDDFDRPTLNPLWQWNHLPDDSKWSLSERKGYLRLHSLPATDLWWARNSLTQKAVGPQSQPSVILESDGLQVGDIAGLALFNHPYAYLAVERQADGDKLVYYNQLNEQREVLPLQERKIWLRADCDFLREVGHFSYSLDGQHFKPIGAEVKLIFQLKTFQGVRYALFNFNSAGVEGGYADFDQFEVAEPYPNGLMNPIPFGKTISLESREQALALVLRDGQLVGQKGGQPLQFKVLDRGLGRVALMSSEGALTVGEDGVASLQHVELSNAQTFQWMEQVYGEPILMSLVSHRFLAFDEKSGQLKADHPGPSSLAQSDACWKISLIEE